MKDSAVVELTKMRIRWRRWLGQKTRYDRTSWADLLDSSWQGWCQKVADGHGLDLVNKLIMSRLEIHSLFLRCINVATIDELFGLDNLYINEKLGL